MTHLPYVIAAYSVAIICFISLGFYSVVIYRQKSRQIAHLTRMLNKATKD